MIKSGMWRLRSVRLAWAVVCAIWVGLCLAGCSHLGNWGSSSSDDQDNLKFSEAEGLDQDEARYREKSQGDFPKVSSLQRDKSLFLKPDYYDPQQRPLRIGLLVPFTSEDANISSLAQSFYNASQLAVMAQRNKNVLLIPADTGNTAASAQKAAQSVIDKGADIIVGPLLGSSVAQVAPTARRYAVPVIAFSNDNTVASNGVYLLSFLPEMDVYSIGRYALSQGLKRFAVLAPDTDYGRRSTRYFMRFINQNGGTVVNVFEYPSGQQNSNDPVQSADTAQLINAVSQLAESAKNNPYDAIFIPDGGISLKTVAPMLPYFRIDTNTVRVLGTSLFDDETLTSVRGLEGAWFPAVSPGAYKEFFADYQSSYGSLPPKMASLPYDATNLAISLDQFYEEDGSIPLYLITRRKGFMGSTGMFRFTPSGYIERSMSIARITSSGIKIVQEASVQFSDMRDAPALLGGGASYRVDSGIAPEEPGAPVLEGNRG